MNSAGYSTAGLTGAFVEGWKHSPPHRRNMLDPAVTETGVGIAQSARTRRWYAVQLFGKPLSSLLTFSIANDTAHAVDYRLGSKVYDLPPRVTRTHRQCEPEPLAIGNGRDAVETTARDGRRYHWVQDSAGGRGHALREDR